MKNRRAIILMFSAHTVSGFAQGISMLAIPWYFAKQGESEWFNLMYGFITFALLFWSLPAGTLVDRFDRKHVFMGSNAVGAVWMSTVAIVGFIQGGLAWPWLVGVFGYGFFHFLLHYPNLYAFAQELTDAKNYTKITSQIEIVGQATNMAAGALAALLLEGVNWQANLGALGTLHITLAQWTIWEIFLLDASTFILAFGLIALIKYQTVTPRFIQTDAFWLRLRTGLRFLWQRKPILTFGALSHAIFVSMLVQMNALAPAYITNHLQAGGAVWGAFELFYSCGAIIAGFSIRHLFKHMHKARAVHLLMGLAMFVLAIKTTTQSIPLFLFGTLLYGVANGGVRVMRMSYLYTLVPNDVMGRVTSVFGLTNVFMRATLIFIFALPWFGQGNNVIYGYATLFVFVALCLAGLLLVHPRMKHL